MSKSSQRKLTFEAVYKKLPPVIEYRNPYSKAKRLYYKFVDGYKVYTLKGKEFFVYDVSYEDKRGRRLEDWNKNVSRHSFLQAARNTLAYLERNKLI